MICISLGLFLKESDFFSKKKTKIRPNLRKSLTIRPKVKNKTKLSTLNSIEQVDSLECVTSEAATALHQTVSEPLPHEAVDDKVDGAVEDQHHVIDIVHDQ